MTYWAAAGVVLLTIVFQNVRCFPRPDSPVLDLFSTSSTLDGAALTATVTNRFDSDYTDNRNLLDLFSTGITPKVSPSQNERNLSGISFLGEDALSRFTPKIYQKGLRKGSSVSQRKNDHTNSLQQYQSYEANYAHPSPTTSSGRNDILLQGRYQQNKDPVRGIAVSQHTYRGQEESNKVMGLVVNQQPSNNFREAAIESQKSNNLNSYTKYPSNDVSHSTSTTHNTDRFNTFPDNTHSFTDMQQNTVSKIRNSESVFAGFHDSPISVQEPVLQNVNTKKAFLIPVSLYERSFAVENEQLENTGVALHSKKQFLEDIPKISQTLGTHISVSKSSRKFPRKHGKYTVPVADDVASKNVDNYQKPNLTDTKVTYNQLASLTRPFNVDGPTGIPINLPGLTLTSNLPDQHRPSAADKHYDSSVVNGAPSSLKPDNIAANRIAESLAYNLEHWTFNAPNTKQDQKHTNELDIGLTSRKVLNSYQKYSQPKGAKLNSHNKENLSGQHQIIPAYREFAKFPSNVDSSKDTPAEQFGHTNHDRMATGPNTIPAFTLANQRVKYGDVGSYQFIFPTNKQTTNFSKRIDVMSKRPNSDVVYLQKPLGHDVLPSPEMSRNDLLQPDYTKLDSSKPDQAVNLIYSPQKPIEQLYNTVENFQTVSSAVLPTSGIETALDRTHSSPVLAAGVDYGIDLSNYDKNKKMSKEFDKVWHTPQINQINRLTGEGNKHVLPITKEPTYVYYRQYTRKTTSLPISRPQLNKEGFHREGWHNTNPHRKKAVHKKSPYYINYPPDNYDKILRHSNVDTKSRIHLPTTESFNRQYTQSHILKDTFNDNRNISSSFHLPVLASDNRDIKLNNLHDQNNSVKSHVNLSPNFNDNRYLDPSFAVKNHRKRQITNNFIQTQRSENNNHIEHQTPNKAEEKQAAYKPNNRNDSSDVQSRVRKNTRKYFYHSDTERQSNSFTDIGNIENIISRNKNEQNGRSPKTYHQSNQWGMPTSWNISQTSETENVEGAEGVEGGTDNQNKEQQEERKWHANNSGNQYKDWADILDEDEDDDDDDDDDYDYDPVDQTNSETTSIKK